MNYKIDYDGTLFTVTLNLKGVEVKLSFSETIKTRDKLNEALTEIQHMIAYGELDGYK